MSDQNTPPYPHPVPAVRRTPRTRTATGPGRRRPQQGQWPQPGRTSRSRAARTGGRSGSRSTAAWPAAAGPAAAGSPQPGSQQRRAAAGRSTAGWAAVRSARSPQYGQPGQAPYGPGRWAGVVRADARRWAAAAGAGSGTGSTQWQPEPKKKRGKVIPLIAALAMVLVVAGGGIFAYGKLKGGDQPAAVLPGTAVAYARVDLNPSAGQKVAAIRFLMKFPSVKDKLGLTGEKDDLRQKLFEQIKKYAGDDLADVDYDKDVKPWLGERAGIAALPPADGKDDPVVVVAVQVKNEGEATKGLDKLMAERGQEAGPRVQQRVRAARRRPGHRRRGRRHRQGQPAGQERQVQRGHGQARRAGLRLGLGRHEGHRLDLRQGRLRGAGRRSATRAWPPRCGSTRRTSS